MIRARPSPEPRNFAVKVQQPGDAFIARTPNPTNADWCQHPYWQCAHTDLYDRYQGICMYCASWTPRNINNRGLDHTSVDHYIPKSVDPKKAYRWDNFRLCRTRLNRRKGQFQDVADPFLISNGLFTIDFTTFLIRPNPTALIHDADAVQKTIDRLQLNTDTDYVQERIEAIRSYCMQNGFTLQQFRLRYPFIADQMVRQNFDTVFKSKLKAIFNRFPAT